MRTPPAGVTIPARRARLTASARTTAAFAHAVVSAALARGLLLLTCGTYGNCIRVLVPLVVTDDELEEALGAWEEALGASLD